MGWNKFTIGCRCCGPPPDTVASCSCPGVPKSIALTFTRTPGANARPENYWWTDNTSLTYYQTDPGTYIDAVGVNAWSGPGWYSPIVQSTSGGGIAAPKVWYMVCASVSFRLWLRTKDAGGQNPTWTSPSNNFKTAASRFFVVQETTMSGANQTPGAACSPFAMPTRQGALIYTSGIPNANPSFWPEYAYTIGYSGGSSAGTGTGTIGDPPTEGGDFAGE